MFLLNNPIIREFARVQLNRVMLREGIDPIKASTDDVELAIDIIIAHWPNIQEEAYAR